MKGKKMKTLMSNIGWIIAALLFAFAFMGALRYAAGRYKRVPPSKVGILFGRKRVYKVLQADGSEREEKLGFRLLTGGGVLITVLALLKNFIVTGIAHAVAPLLRNAEPDTLVIIASQLSDKKKLDKELKATIEQLKKLKI
ncbi:MAG TPA: hypothetical protein VJB11_02315 [archaeon]|nr:hypothetical protein [archaeon]